MFTLLIGGAASGKSALAERVVQTLPGERYYIATMIPGNREGYERIARHRRQRTGKAFTTLECYNNLFKAEIPANSNVLLEDIGNLLANELFAPAGGGAEAVQAGIDALLLQASHVTAVTNDVFCGGTAYGDETLHYLRELAHINRLLAKRADVVAEVVCGIPNLLKGAPSW